MKVYATKISDNKVVICEWPSKAAFELQESWVDPKFINVATSKDLGTYADFGEYKSMIVYTPEQVASHNLLKAVANA